MTFKNFYYKNKNNKAQIFEDVFESFYDKGYFGKLDKQQIKEQQFSWFNKLILLLDEGDHEIISEALKDRDGISRQFVSKIYGEEISELSRNDIKDFLKRAIK